jgi:hypothetical protein
MADRGEGPFDRYNAYRARWSIAVGCRFDLFAPHAAVQPRIALQHYPKQIREIVPPKSRKERRMSVLFGLVIGVPYTVVLLWRTATLGTHSFRELFAYAFGVLFIFNLFDLLILDWLIVCWIEPRWAILPGTEHIVLPKQYLHHFKGFLMGTVGLAVVGLAIAALLSIQF